MFVETYQPLKISAIVGINVLYHDWDLSKKYEDSFPHKINNVIHGINRMKEKVLPQ